MNSISLSMQQFTNTVSEKLSANSKQLEANSEQLNSKVDKLQEQMANKFENNSEQLNNKVDKLQEQITDKLESASKQLEANSEQINSKVNSLQEQFTDNAEHLQEQLLNSSEQLNNRVVKLQEDIGIRISDVTKMLDRISIECKERSDDLQKQIDDMQVDLKGKGETLDQIKESIVGRDRMLETTRRQVDTHAELLARLQIDLGNIKLVDRDEELELGRRLNSELNIVSDSTRNKITIPKKIRSEGVRNWPQSEENPTTFRDLLSTDSDSSDSQGSLAHRRKKQKTILRLREPLFFGNGQTTAPEFIKELEDYFALMDIVEDKEKIMAFKQMLRGNHAKWCQIQLADTTSWKQLCKRFIAQYFNTTELAQEWESLHFNTYSRDCEGFILKAWQLQTSLHADYNTHKKCSNIIRKLPFHIQVRVKENLFDTFDDFLRIVKITIKSFHSSNPNYYYTNRYPNTSSPPKSPQNSERSGQRQNIKDKSNYFNKYQGKQNPNGSRNNNRYYGNRNNEYRQRFNRSWDYRGPRQNSYRERSNYNYNNKPYENNNRQNRSNNYNKQKPNIGAITWVPIEGQPGAYTMSPNNNKLLTITSPPRSPNRNEPSTSTKLRSPVHPNMKS